MLLKDKIERLIEFNYSGGANGTCYECPYASKPLRKDGSEASYQEVFNDPTEAYYRCSLPGRDPDKIAWGEYSPCSLQEWLEGAIMPEIQILQNYAAEAVSLRLQASGTQTIIEER